MRKVREIEAELAAARAAYHEAAADESAAKLYERSRAIKDLMRQLAEAYTEGAEPCPDCGNSPHGLKRKTPIPAIDFVEIGCLACPSRRAQGMTVEEAVEKWNRGELVEAPPTPETTAAETT